jgi:hypothetical protein
LVESRGSGFSSIATSGGELLEEFELPDETGGLSTGFVSESACSWSETVDEEYDSDDESSEDDVSSLTVSEAIVLASPLSVVAMHL